MGWFGKEQGLICKTWDCPQNLELFMWRKSYEPSPWGHGPKELSGSTGPWWTGAYPFANLIVSLGSWSDSHEWMGLGQRWPLAAQPGCGVTEPPESYWNGAPVHWSSPREVEEGEGTTTTPFLELVERGEVTVALTMVGSGRWHSVPVGLDEEKGSSSGEGHRRCAFYRAWRGAQAAGKGGGTAGVTTSHQWSPYLAGLGGG
jgi:hypothetical protein